MAGVLMVFALSLAITRDEAIRATETVEQWRELKKRLCDDPELEAEGVHVECETGALLLDFGEYGFNETALRNDMRTQLRKMVPLYLSRLRERPELWNEITQIEVGGHADPKTKHASANYHVSMERAEAVMVYLFQEDSMLEFQSVLATKGKVVSHGSTEVPKACWDRDDFDGDNGACPEARRVELRIHLNERGVLNKLVEMLRLSREREDTGT